MAQPIHAASKSVAARIGFGAIDLLRDMCNDVPRVCALHSRAIVTVL